MSESGLRRALGEMLVGRAAIALTILADSAFLAIWLGILFILDYFIGKLGDSDHWDWQAARMIFAVATLILIVMYIAFDLIAAFRGLRANLREGNSEGLAEAKEARSSDRKDMMDDDSGAGNV